MMKSIALIALIALFIGCQDAPEKPQEVTKKESLIVQDGDLFKEFYPGKKQVKIEGRYDADNKRHGKWTFYHENGQEGNFTFYQHGKKHGHSYTSYPNGAPYYYGEYKNDTMVGQWKFYDKKGEYKIEDYGTLAEQRKR